MMNKFFEDLTKPLLVALLLGIAGLFVRFELMAYKVDELYNWKKYQTDYLNEQLDEIINQVQGIDKDVNVLKSKIEDRLKNDR